ncbi:MAG: DUF2335 domain-containing protein [Methylococcaceae bacterium]
MSDQTDTSQKDHPDAQESSNQLPEETPNRAESAKQELIEIQELLNQFPEELLASALAEKIQQKDSPIGLLNVVKAVSQQFSGPIPPPHILGDYDKVQEGFAERIIAMAEKEQGHRHDIEYQALSSEISIQKRGQIFALIVSMIILGGSMLLIYSGKEISGSVLAGSSLIGLAYLFITGRKSDDTTDKEG